jgi:hypothetical protein
MIPILAELTVRGSLLCGLVWLLESGLGTRIQAQSRRLWWAIAALAFLLPLRLHIHCLTPYVPLPVKEVVANLANPKLSLGFTIIHGGIPADGAARTYRLTDLAILIWLTGIGISLAIVIFQTVRTNLRWSQEQLCTEPGPLLTTHGEY